jgi:hypothetical protein
MSIFDLVKANVNTYDIAVAEGFNPTKNKLICCPFHGEKHPSMKVDNRFYCFACGEKGDVIDFVGRLYGLNPKDAAEKIIADFGLGDIKEDSKIKEYKRQQSEQQAYLEKKRNIMKSLSELMEKLQMLKTSYRPRQEQDSTWSPVFCFASNKYEYVSYLYEYVLFEVTDVQLTTEIDGLIEEVKKIEREFNEQISGRDPGDVGNIGEGMAV